MDEELDAFGLTHPGKVQRVNQEHFLIFSVMRDASQANVAQKGWENPGAEGMATGLAVFVGIWPRGYILRMGKSRIYRLADGHLDRTDTMMHQVSTDQARGEHSQDANLWANDRPMIEEASSLPIIRTFAQKWGAVGFMCTKGLTKHVPDEQIHKRLSCAASAKQACQELLEDALNAGGTENITMIVAQLGNPHR